MTSAAEQLAQNFSWSTFSKARDLQQRLLFTLGALIVFRFGIFIPLPGIDVEVYRAAYGGDDDSAFQALLQQINLFAGGALENLSIFSLSIFPYISASIIMQLMRTVIPEFERLQKEGESGRRKMNQYTRYLTVMIALFQALGIAVLLENFPGVDLVMNGGFIFRITTMVTLTGGTVFLMWLGEQITARGVGNGISLIIFAGIVANLPTAFAQTLELGRTGALSALFIIGFLAFALAVVAFIVFFERAQRRIIVQYPKRQVGNRMFGGESSHIPLKLNTSGVIPIIFATSILLTPVSLAGFSEGSASGTIGLIMAWIGRGTPLFFVLFAALIIFFSFFYTAIVFNPQETAENLKKNGGFVPGIRPGKNTAEFFDYVLTRLTVVGTLYLVAVALLPEILITRFAVPFFFGGTSLLIVVVVSLDTVAQIQSHLLAHQYEGLIRKAKLKGRRG